MPDADTDAMQRLAGGEDLALNEIIARWQDRLTTFLWHMTHDHAAARDLAQETFVRLYLHRRSYRPRAPFPSYLFRIARNLLTNHARWKSRHPSESLQVLNDLGFDPASPGNSPDEALVQEETARQVRHAIRTLPPDLRAPLVLSTYQGLSHREIALLLDCTEKAAETRLYRARQHLKSRLTR